MIISTFKKVSVIYLISVILMSCIAVYYLTRQQSIALLDLELQQVEQSNSKMAKLISGVYDDNLLVISLQQSVQNALKNDSSTHTFLSVFNWSGKIIAHPDPVKLGSTADYYDATTLKEKDALSVEAIYDQLSYADTDQVISIKSIKNTDWIIASHIKTQAFQKLSRQVFFNNIVLFTIIDLVLLLLFFVVLRFLKSNLEREIQLKQSVFADGMSSIEALNKNLVIQQTSILEEIDKVKNEVKVSNHKVITAPVTTATDKVNKDLEQVEIHTDGYKTRILTYLRNELVSLAVEDIAVIYVDHTITYFLRFDGKKSTSSDSLDQIFSSLNPKLFFKANRQFIVSITAIEKISKYGNSQLKLKTKPAVESEIIIGKNKAASFKKWLNI